MLSLGNKLTLNTQPIYKFVNKYSIDFDGVDDCIVTDGADTVAQPTTYSFWCKSSETGTNNGVFGHGSDRIGAFHFNRNADRPQLFLGTNYLVIWNDTSAQDDGEWHHWVVYSDTNDITNSKLYVDGVLQSQSFVNSSGSLNSYTESLTIGGDQAVGGNYFEGQIDEFAVFDRELTQDEITRMYNTYYSPNRVANGNFSQIGNEEVTNGDFSQEGSELVTNGDFATDSDWSKATGWTISGGLANANTTAYRTLAQNIPIILGKKYKVVYDVVSFTSGSVSMTIGADSGILRNAVGTYSEIIEYNNFYSSSGIRSGASGFVGSVDNVSVKEVGQDWSFGTGWSMGDGKAVRVASSSTDLVQASVFPNLTSIFKISFDVVRSAGSVRLRAGTYSLPYVSTTDTYTYYVTPVSNDQLKFQADSSFVGSIDNVSVKEVGQGWNFDSSLTGGAWSTDGTKAICDGTQTGNISFKETSNPLIQGRTYRITYDISNYQAGDINPHFKGTGTGNVSGNGFKTASGVAGSSSDGLNMYAGSTFVGDIDNIVLQELKHDATNLMLNAGAYQSANPLITSTKSMDFDGTDDYLQLSEPISYTNHTICGWAYSGVTNANNIIFSASDSASDGIRLMFRSSSNFRYRINGQNIDTAADTREGNRWYFVCGTYDGTTARIYIDGVELANATTSQTISTPDISARIGSNSYEESSFFDGKITEVGAYNRALTSLEVASLYNQGMPTNLLVNRNNYQSGNPTVFNTKQVDFDGADDYMIANSTLGSFTGSISAWVYRDTNTSYQFITDFRGEGNTGTGYFYFLENSNNTSASSGTIYVDGIAGIIVPADGNWHHVVVTGIALDITESILFGRFYSSNTYNLNGKISQVGLWNSTLTADEVSSLYNHGLPIDLTTNQASYESSSNLVGYWRMGSGTLDSYPLIADQTNATLGSELLTDGNFPTGTTAFSVGSNWSIANNKASYDNLGSSSLIQNLTFESGKTYQIEFDVLDFTSNYRFDIYTGVSFIQSAIITDKTSFKIYFVGDGGSYIRFRGLTTGSFAIKNLSVKKVNGNPAIMTNQTSSDIENGSPYANTVQYPNDFSQYSYGGTAPTLTTGQLAPDGTLTATKVSGVLNSTSLYRDSESSTTASRSIYARTVSGTGTVNLMSYGGNTNNNFTITEEWQKFELTGSIATGGSNFYAVDFRFPGVNPLTELIIWGGNSQEPNTGLQGYWKMGDGTNDEYPVIYDQTNPTLGSELVTNGDFATDSDWSFSGGGIEISNGKLNFTSTTREASQSISIVNGKTYKVNYEISDYTSGDVRVELGSSNGLSRNAIGIYTEYIVSTGTSTVQIDAVSVFTGSIDNISVKEVQGNPATMTNMVEGNITNQYPLTKIRNYYRMGDGILDGYPIIQDQTSPNLAHIPTTNLVTYSEDTSQWTDSGITYSVDYIISPDGTLNASKAIINDTITSSNTRPMTSVAVTSGTNYVFSVFGKADEFDMINLDFSNTAFSTVSVDYNLTNGTVTSFVGSPVSQGVEDYGNGWYRCYVVATAIATTTTALIIRLDDNPTGDGTSGLYLWGAQFEEQSQATAYIKSDGIAAVRKSSTTNLITYSEDFSQWTRTGSTTISATNITSPIGATNATRITGLTGSGGNDLYLIVGGNPASKTYSFSVYLKGSGTLRLQISNNVDQGIQEIVTLTSDWKRHIVTGTFNSTSGNLSATLDDNGATATQYNIWGAQLEEQTQAEIYAPTTGLPVTIDLFTENNYGTMTNMSASDIIEDTP